MRITYIVLTILLATLSGCSLPIKDIPIKKAQWFYDVDPSTGNTLGASIGRVTQVEDPSDIKLGRGSEKYWYDSRGHVTRKRKCVQLVCMESEVTYDVAGRPWHVTYPDEHRNISPNSEVIEYQYDVSGRLEKSAAISPQQQSYVDKITYESDDRPKALVYGNGVQTEFTYDPARQWLNSINIKRAETENLYSADYKYDSAGRLKTLTESNPVPRSLNLKYDELDRLRLVEVNGAESQKFDYDALGNMASNSKIGNYVYGDPKHVHAATQAGSTTYGYDDNGNLNADAGREIQWNEDDLPTVIKTNNGTTTFAYDASGDRISKMHLTNGSRNITSTRYFGILIEQDQDGSLVKYYFAGPRLIARRDNNGIKWYHQDSRSSIQLLTDELGRPVAQYIYDAFGRLESSPGNTGNSIGFAGHRADDETGLVYMRARYYDPELARFISADSVVPDPLNPQALNRYSYVYNNPYGYTDPTGSLPVECQPGPYSTCVSAPRLPSRALQEMVWKMVFNLGYHGDRFTDHTQKTLVQQGRYSVWYPEGKGPGKPFMYVICPTCHGKGPAPGSISYQMTNEEEELLYEITYTGINLLGGSLLSSVRGAEAIKEGVDIARALPKGKRPNGVAVETAEANAVTNASNTAGVDNAANNVNAQDALRSKLSGLEKAQKNPAAIRTLPDGRIRYYTSEVPATNPGPTRGASFVTEYNPKTGQVRQWMESYDQAGNVVRVHPKTLNGQILNSQHYPPTGRELR